MVNFSESQPSSEMNKPFILNLMVGFHNEPLYRYHHYLCLDIVAHAFPFGRWSLSLSVTSPPMLPEKSQHVRRRLPGETSGSFGRKVLSDFRVTNLSGDQLIRIPGWVCILFFGYMICHSSDMTAIVCCYYFDAIGPFANVGLLTIIDLTIEHNSPSNIFMINNHPYALDYFSYMCNYPHPSLLTIGNDR